MEKGTRIGRIWKIDKEELRTITSQSKSFADIFRKMEYFATGISYKSLKERLVADNIDFSHIPQGMDSNRGRKFIGEKIPFDKVLIENSTYSRGSLKKRLIKEGLLKNECSVCKLLPNWNNLQLIMIIDHINGIRNDNRIENLRLLCPNCNSQQSTFSGKNKIIVLKTYCQKCGKKISKQSLHCNRCAGLLKYEKEIANRPSKEQLIAEVTENGWTITGEKYHVSGNTIKKWLKIYGFEFEKRVHPKHIRRNFVTVCNSKSGFIGVKLNKRTNKWESNIALKGNNFYLGSFNTPEEAHQAYIKKRKELYNVKNGLENMVLNLK